MPDAPSAKVEEEPAPSPEAAAKNKKMIALLLRVAIFAALSATAFAVVWLVVRPLLPAPAAAEAKARPTAEKFGRVVSLDSVVVNAAQTEDRLSQDLGRERVRRVFITEFVVQ